MKPKITYHTSREQLKAMMNPYGDPDKMITIFDAMGDAMQKHLDISIRAEVDNMELVLRRLQAELKIYRKYINK